MQFVPFSHWTYFDHLKYSNQLRYSVQFFLIRPLTVKEVEPFHLERQNCALELIKLVMHFNQVNHLSLSDYVNYSNWLRQIMQLCPD